MNNDNTLPFNPQPQRAPPLPPLKLPLVDADEVSSHQGPQFIHVPPSPKTESVRSKSSLDHELRQYQQYSERIHKLADGSVESFTSYGQSRSDNERNSFQVKQSAIPNLKTNESDQHQGSRQGHDILAPAKAPGDDTFSDPTQERKYLESKDDTPSPSEPSISSSLHHLKTKPTFPSIALSGSPNPSITDATPIQSVQHSKRLSTQTKENSRNEIGRRSNDSFYWQPANSHNSSCSLSEEESQLRSADAVPPHSIITRPNPKIISIVSPQRNSEPTRKLASVVLPGGHHSASALGLGGPSDWEHFGDYEAEEVDDTDLYSRSKPEIAINIADDAAELPADTMPVDNKQSLVQSKQVEPCSNPKHAPSSSLHDIVSLENHKPEQNFAICPGENKESPATESKTEAKASGVGTRQSLKIEPESPFQRRQSVDVDEIIRAWSGDSMKDKVRKEETSKPLQHSNREPSGSHAVKPSHESQSEALPSSDVLSDLPVEHPQVGQSEALTSSDNLSDLPVEHPQVGQSEALLSSLSLDKPEALSLEDNSPIVQHAPMPAERGNKDEEISSMVNEGTPEVKQFKVDPEPPNDRITLQEKGSATSLNDPSTDPPHGMMWNLAVIAPNEPSDSTSVDSNPASLMLSRDESPGTKSVQLKDNELLKLNEIDSKYAELDPWGRASLHRYISMLHEEAKAKTDVAKLKIFTVFATRETKLRAVLYAADDDAITVPHNVDEESPRDPADLAAKRSEKALPALPPEGEPQGRPPGESSAEQTVSESGSAIVQEDIKTSLMIDSPSNETQYSPGGRPLLPREMKDEKPSNPVVEVKTPRERVNKVLTQFANYIYPAQSPSLGVPSILVSEDAAPAQKPAYIPYKYNHTDGEPISYLSKRQSAYRPYAALTMGSLDNGSRPTIELDKKKNMGGSVLDLQQQNGQDNQSLEPTTRPPEVAGLGEEDQIRNEPDLRRFVTSDFDPLHSVLPSSGVILQDSTGLQELHISMDAFPDDFSFIHQSVVAWDAVAKKERERFERERHLRQGESERKIDELFDDQEIGYGDISELEAEFKRSEASRKADENRHEYKTFLLNVFDVVWTRLHYEIDHLTPLYDQHMTSIKESLVGKDMFEVSTVQFTLAPLMSTLLALHQKLEVRHQKAFEAVLERDRRLKKTEVSAWYSLGNVSKVKELERQFEDAEKNAIVAYCQQRDVRANHLMDVLDHNTLRGVGANQDYMECLMKAVRRVASGRAFASVPSSDPGLGIEEVKKAKSITTALATSSEQIVRTFHVADMLLNAADYELSVAKAKLANSDAGTFKRLKEERTKEDQKLMRELEHRLALIREDTRRTHDEISKLLLFLGVENGHHGIAQSVPETITRSGPEERIQKALNHARMTQIPKESEDRATH